MTRTIAALCLVLAFLTTLTGTASARAVNDLENRVGVFGSFTSNDAYATAPQAVEPHRENTVSVYDSATGVWEYVNQNPWTFWDPQGLSLVGKGAKKVLKRPRNAYKEYRRWQCELVSLIATCPQWWERHGWNSGDSFRLDPECSF